MNAHSPSCRRTRCVAGWRAGVLAALAAAGPLARAEIVESVPPADTPPPRSALVEFVDGLPDLINFSLPTVGPPGMCRLYVHPHFGDFLHKDYLRLPVGARINLNPQWEFSGELQSYFTHGLRNSAGDGLYGLLLGVKNLHTFADRTDAGWNTGINFSTPLSRPPLELTDGYRHTLPYVSATYPLLPKYKIVGYSTVGADLLDRTPLPSMFARNQLHGNSLSFVTGAARDFPRFQLSMTATYGTTALLSNEHNEVFGLHPSILFPIRPLTNSRLKAMLTVGGRAIWGPDGRETGVSTSLRVEFDIKKTR